MSKIKKATGDSIKKAVDTISEKESQRITAEAIAPSGGEVVLVLGPQEGATSRTDVKFKRAFSLSASSPEHIRIMS